jgi:hypothetical protein
MHNKVGRPIILNRMKMWKYSMLWGIGAQIRLIGGLHSITEIFYGDSYVGNAGGAYQIGLRYFISEKFK